jgi:hypothetical protein
MKKLFFASILLTLLTVFSGPTVFAFSDVDSEQWYSSAVGELSSAGIVTGYSDGSFQPGNSVTRAEIVVMLSRVLSYLDSDTSMGSSVSFTDVSEGQWYSDEVIELSASGIVNGYSDATFRPGNEVTRAEVVVMLSRLLLALDDTGTASSSRTFSDVSTGQWYSDAVFELADREIVNGYSDSTFRPGNNVTRAEIAVMLSRLLSYLNTDEELVSCGTDFDCFIEASLTCALAEMDNTASIDLFGVTETVEATFSLNGLEDGKCTFVEHFNQIDLVFPEDTDQATVDQQNAVYDTLEGTDRVCLFEIEDLAVVLEDWSQGNFSTSDYDEADCE